jgi:heptosyltransferase-2
MSLLSTLGIEIANEKKLANKKSFQYWLFHMLELSFKGEGYDIYINKKISPQKNLVGIEARAGKRWPNKCWSGYEELIKKLIMQGFAVKVLSQRNTIREYLDDIASCSYIISGDTLAMHVAMAYKKPCIAIFNCTSPDEIYDYGILKKIVSLQLQQSFYSQQFSSEIIGSIKVEKVFDCFLELISKFPLNKPLA